MKVSSPAAFMRLCVLLSLATTSCSDSHVLAPPAPAPASVAAITIKVTPRAPAVLAGGSRQFTALVVGSTSGVTWSASGGSIDAAGFFTAPIAAGAYTITTTSVDDAGITAEATATVPVITVTPSVSEALMKVGRRMRFSAVVEGAFDRTVSWSATGGSVSPAVGRFTRYTAPATPGTYNLIATSVADPTKSATIVITVEPLAQITIGFARCELRSSAGAYAQMHGTDLDSQLETLENGEGGADCALDASNSYSTSAAALAGGQGNGASSASYTFGRAGLEWGSNASLSSYGFGHAPYADYATPYYHGSGFGNASSAQTFGFTVGGATASITVQVTLNASCSKPDGANAVLTLSLGGTNLDQELVLCEDRTVSWTRVLQPGEYVVRVGANAQAGGSGTTHISCEVEHFPYGCGDPGPISISNTNTAAFNYTIRLQR